VDLSHSGLGLLGRDEQDAVDLVDLDELHLDALVAGGGQVLTHVVGSNRKLAMTSVRKARELNAGGTAVIEERLDRGPNRAPGVEDVVHEYACHSFEWKVELRGADERLRVLGRLPAAHLDVVAVERDVDCAERELLAREIVDQPAKAVCERDPPRMDADQCNLFQVRITLDDLVRDPGERPLDRLAVEENLLAGPRTDQDAGGIAGLRAAFDIGLLSGLTGPS
jgi:hypothetical protein